MGILENLESAWDDEFSFESSKHNLNIFSETCCNGCGCTSEADHKK